MGGRPEDILLFYAALAEPDATVLRRVRDLIDRGIDHTYLEHMAKVLGVAVGLLNLLSCSNDEGNDISDGLRRAAAGEVSRTVSMELLFRRVAGLLESEAIPFIPLKGSDIRIAGGARRSANPMTDVDILVRTRDMDRTRGVLQRNGFLFLGAMSGAHLNFATDEDHPRFLEVHDDLVNRWSPVQRRLFRPDLEKIWERSAPVCGRLHLSPEDLICYTLTHGVKESFHRPKWAADAEYLIRDVLPGLDPETVRARVGEWGVGSALGVLAEAFLPVLGDKPYDHVYALGAGRPGAAGRFAANRLFRYSHRRGVRTALYFACARGLTERLSLALGMAEYLFRRVRRGGNRK